VKPANNWSYRYTDIQHS